MQILYEDRENMNLAKQIISLKKELSKLKEKRGTYENVEEYR